MDSTRAPLVAQAWEIITQLLPSDAPLKAEPRETSFVLTPTAPDTFSITVYEEHGELMLSAARWHTHFDDPAECAFCARWLLTPYARVVHEVKGGVLAAVWTERYEPTGWEGYDPVYFLNPEYPPNWELPAGFAWIRRTHTQAVLPPPVPYAQVMPGVTLDEDALPPGLTLGTHLFEVPTSMARDLFEPEEEDESS